VRVQVYFYTRDLNLNLTHAEPGLGAVFVFHPWVHPKPKTRKKPEKNLKETRKPPKETHLQNPTGTRTQPKT
jgi:hypothetical protein